MSRFHTFSSLSNPSMVPQPSLILDVLRWSFCLSPSLLVWLSGSWFPTVYPWHPCHHLRAEDFSHQCLPKSPGIAKQRSWPNRIDWRSEVGMGPLHAGKEKGRKQWGLSIWPSQILPLFRPMWVFLQIPGLCFLQTSTASHIFSSHWVPTPWSPMLLLTQWRKPQEPTAQQMCLPVQGRYLFSIEKF